MQVTPSCPVINATRVTLEEKTYGLTSRIENSPSFAHVSVTLNNEDTGVVGDNGAMLWQNATGDGLNIDTGCHNGGCCAGYWRGTYAGEHFCMNKYTGTGEIAFGFDLPGDIVPFTCSSESGWYISKGSFICGTSNLVVSAKWAGCYAFCCSGEGGMLTWVHANSNGDANMFYAGGFGEIRKQAVPSGMTLYVNNGLFFAAPDDMCMEIAVAGGCCTTACLYSGEGWVMTFEGPTTVFTQNRDPDVFLALLNPAPAKQAGNDEDGGDGA